jgi:hypothetical protein
VSGRVAMRVCKFARRISVADIAGHSVIVDRKTRAPRFVATYSVLPSTVPMLQTCDSMEAAIATACKLIMGGATVHRINGADGFVMEHGDIEIECLRRQTRDSRLDPCHSS